MANTKRSQGGPSKRFDDGPEDAEAKVLKDARMEAEQRFRKILERRNALNDEARQARETRDALNLERRKLYDEIQQLVAQREAVQAKIKEHKAARNAAQGRARQLIGLKQEKRKGAVGGAGQKVRELETQVKALEFKQQTVPMSGPAEQELLDEIKVKLRELEEVRKVKAQQDAIFGEVKDLDQAINESFAKADAEHAEVVKLSNAWQEIASKLEPAFQQLGAMKGQADQKHQQFLELRKRADEEHAKAGELRSEVDQKRDAVDKLYQERRDLVQAIKAQARSLDDPNALEASADEAVRALLSRGRISLSG